MGVIAGVNADIYLSSTPSIGTTNESCDNTDAGLWVTYRAHIHYYWDKTQTFTVQCSPNGTSSWSTVTDYTVQWVGGYIVFNTPRTSGVNNFVRISVGSYFNVTEVATSNKWDLKQNAEQADTTVFQNIAAFHQRTATLQHGTVTFSTFVADNSFYTLLTNLAVVVCYLNLAQTLRFEAYAYITNDSYKAAVTSVVSQDISFDIEGPIYYRTAA